MRIGRRKSDMAANFEYNEIIKYKIKACCVSPLHIGSATGQNGEVLIHPVDGKPFIQASSIAGAFRNAYALSYGEEETEKLFGNRHHEEETNASENGSHICFSDASFVKDDTSNIKIELRPHVRIDRNTGTVESAKVKGTTEMSGQKFDMEYIGAGAKFWFDIYLYKKEDKKEENEGETKKEKEESTKEEKVEKEENTKEEKVEKKAEEAKVENILKLFHLGQIQIGGKKSNGSGYIELEKLLKKSFDMTSEDDRELWIKEESLEDVEYEDCLSTLKLTVPSRNSYEVKVIGKTENALLIKSIAVSGVGEGVEDSRNIQNAKGEYIIPGSSLKGALSSQMERIAKYLKQDSLIAEIFGTRDNRPEQMKKVGNLFVKDVVVGKMQENEAANLEHRIHIDKFTGGVMHGSLFSEKNIFGELQIDIRIENKSKGDYKPEATLGLLLFALRDLAIGQISLGSGYSVGKGVIDVSRIEIFQPSTEKKASVIFGNSPSILDESDIIGAALKALGGR